jgi:spore coat polysaccharide biosynthesis protein SpsF
MLYENLYSRKEYFDAKDIIRLFKEKPWIRFINKKIAQKKMFDTVDEEIIEALRIIGLNDLNRAKKVFETHLKPSKDREL